MESMHPLTPIVVAIGAIMAFVSLRNSDIATRSRSLMEEMLYKKIIDGSDVVYRHKSIDKQLWWFKYRYALTSVCFVILSISMAALVYSQHLSTLKKNDEAIFFQVVGVYIFEGGLLLFCLEFAVGWRTLVLNGARVAAPPGPATGVTPPPT